MSRGEESDATYQAEGEDSDEDDKKEALRLILIEALEDEDVAQIATDALAKTLLVFDAFWDVEEKMKAGIERLGERRRQAGK